MKRRNKIIFFLDDQSEKDKLCVQSIENNLPVTNNSNDILSPNVNNQDSTKTLELPSKENSNEENLIENCLTKDNENYHLLNNQITKSPQSIEKENELDVETSDNKQEEQLSTINEISNKNRLKRNKRRRNIFAYSSKRKRKTNQIKSSKTQILKQSSFYDQQFWLKKYSIEPFSIVLQRLKLPQQ